MSILVREATSILVREAKISIKALEKAIELKCTNCYGAMSFANALGGSDTDEWYLCHKYSLKELLEEAATQGVNLDNLKSSIDHLPVKQTLYYKRATGEMTEEEFQVAFRKWQRGEKEEGANA